jgi:hypothetical protein
MCDIILFDLTTVGSNSNEFFVIGLKCASIPLMMYVKIMKPEIDRTCFGSVEDIISHYIRN